MVDEGLPEAPLVVDLVGDLEGVALKDHFKGVPRVTTRSRDL